MFVPYPEADGAKNAARHGMVWCAEPDDAKIVAAFETEYTDVPHCVVVVGEDKTPSSLSEVRDGVFVKGGQRRARHRVSMAFNAYEHMENER